MAHIWIKVNAAAPGSDYYWCPSTGLTQWDKPGVDEINLWEAVRTWEDTTYYYNVATRETTWTWELAQEQTAKIQRKAPAQKSNSADAEDIHTVTWEFETANGWHEYLSQDAALLEPLWRACATSNNPQDGGSIVDVEIRGALHKINFSTMEQTNLSTGRVRRVRRIVPGGLPEASASSSASRVAQDRQLQEEIKLLRAELAKEKARADTAEAHVEELRPHASAVQALQEEVGVWRLQEVSPVIRIFEKPHMISIMQQMLRRLVSSDHSGPCECVRHVVVTRVQAVANTQLWKQYSLKRQQIGLPLRTRRNCPWVTDICDKLRVMQEFLPGVQVDATANEVLLMHGTEAAESIARQGFDDRLNHRALYGSGVYLSIDSCKVADPQYCGTGQTCCVIVARAILGHPYEAQGPMQSHLRPPTVEGEDMPHDSIIAKPGIVSGVMPKGKSKGKIMGTVQRHWEFVVSGSQIYPEYIVYYEKR